MRIVTDHGVRWSQKHVVVEEGPYPYDGLDQLPRKVATPTPKDGSWWPARVHGG